MQIIVFTLSLLLSACSMFYTSPIPTTDKPVLSVSSTQELTSSTVTESLINNSKQPNEETTNAKFAYIAEGNGNVVLCTIANDNGLINCHQTGVTTGGKKPNWLPDGIAIYSANNTNYIYVTSNSDVFKCNQGLDNSLINCITTGTASNLKNIPWLPTGVAFKRENNNSYAYVTAVKGVYLCRIASNGDLINCTLSGYGLEHQNMSWVANDITLKDLGSKSYAYISGATRLYQCEIISGGDLINCRTTGTSPANLRIKWHPNSMGFSKESLGYYAYVTDPSKMYECNVDTKGSIINCNASGLYKNDSHWLSNGIAFNYSKHNKYAYVTTQYGVHICTVGKYGSLLNCIDTGFAANGIKLKWNPKKIKLIE